MHDFTAQFQRVNDCRTRRGHSPYADVESYLVDQGFTAAEAKQRADSTATANESGDELAPDAAAIYAQANRSHLAAVFGTEGPNPSADEGHDVDQTHGGRLSGINSPCEYLEHVNSRKSPAASASETRGWNAIAESVYAGPINAQYQDTVATVGERS